MNNIGGILKFPEGGTCIPVGPQAKFENLGYNATLCRRSTKVDAQLSLEATQSAVLCMHTSMCCINKFTTGYMRRWNNRINQTITRICLSYIRLRVVDYTSASLPVQSIHYLPGLRLVYRTVILSAFQDCYDCSMYFLPSSLLANQSNAWWTTLHGGG